ncbi:hypothetical protein BWI17_18580 [Betaproteobacteria bacterium GR16-43]|nr:hypothetical protein BWI17_18580 [Betaproteobacteria bacterium GR16-43]
MAVGVRKQIWSLPAIAVLIFGVGIAAGIGFASNALKHVEHVAVVDYPRLEGVKALSSEVSRITDDFNAAVAEGEKKKLEDAAERAKTIRAMIDKLGALPGQSAFAARVSGLFDAYYDPASKVARVMLGVDKGDTKVAIEAMQVSIRKLNDELDAATKEANAGFGASLDNARSEIQRVLAAMIGASVLVVLVLVIVSRLIVRRIWQQLGCEPEYATRIVKEIARGNLASPIRLAPGDKDSQLAALKGMQESLTGLIAEIRHSTGSVRESTREIAKGMTELSSRTEQQATSLEETASTMEELTATVRQNAQHALKARDLARASTEVATRGGDAVQGVVTTMDEINAGASEIANIVTVIDGIAFQTNILALNAAVEASRAGEQGRGFAVVASEVRSLAQRSAASAKEVKTLIQLAVEKVGAGRKQVAEAGATITQVVESINQVSGVVGEISAASVEQSTGITEIGRAVTQIEGVTHHNAALVEETSAAAQSMSEQARGLEEAVSVFQLGDAQRGPARVAAPRPAAKLPRK